MTTETIRKPLWICNYCNTRVDTESELREHKARHEHEMMVNYHPTSMPIRRPMPEQTPSHLHDLAFTVSAGDLEPEQLAAMRRILEREMQALVERVNIETAPLTGQMVGWYVSYDGSREHGCNA